MKDLSITLYKFSELSEEVKEELVDKMRFDIGYDIMDCWNDDRMETLKKFSELMGVEVYNMRVDYCGMYFNFRFTNETPLMGDYNGKEFYAEDITGKLLRRYLNNNFMYLAIPRKKYYKYEAGWNKEKNRWNKQRYSRIFYESWDNYPLTGVCYDYDILKPIVDCLSKPISDSYSLYDLVEDALHNFFKEWQHEYECWCENQEGCVEEELENRYCNEVFYEDGTMYAR